MGVMVTQQVTKPTGYPPMHALPILHRCLTPLLSHIHARRLATLFEAVAVACAARRCR